MEIAVISDQHLGFDWGGEREEDSFKNCKEAFERVEEADIVLLPGDLFDKKVPRQEVMGRAIDLFRILAEQESDLEICEESDKKVKCRGKPVVAIHGTHERRTEDFLNPVQLLEKAGYLVHLHNEKIVYRKGDEKVAVHGMSGVPERYAPKVLEKFDPRPIEGAFNILMLHQSVKDFVYTDSDRDVLKIEHFPDGFDYIIDGHIHWRNLEMKDDKRPFIIPGSTITTQINQTEADIPKGFLTIDTGGGLEFHELESTRDVFHREIDVSGMTGSEIRERFRDELEEILGEVERAPLVRINLKGETDAEVSVADLRKEYQGESILKVKKDLQGGSKGGQSVEHSEESARDRGMEILEEKLQAPKVKEIFELLSEGETEKAVGELECMDAEELIEDRDEEGETDEDRKIEVEETIEEDSEEDGADSEKEGLKRFVGGDGG